MKKEKGDTCKYCGDRYPHGCGFFSDDTGDLYCSYSCQEADEFQ